MRKLSLLTMIIAGFALTSFTGKQAVVLNSGPVISNEIIDMDFEMFNDCASEWIQFSGQAHVLNVANINNNRITGNMHLNMEGVTGIGETSGTVYRFFGVIIQPYSSPLANGGNTISLITRMKIMGGGNTFTTKGNYHGTINANGDISSFFDNFSATCK